MKRIFKSLIVVITTIFLLCPICFATDVNFKNQIKSEDGSLFEKIIAECIGGIAQTVLDFTTSNTLNVGFKDYDTLIFNKDAQNDSLSPFSQELWNKTMNYYKVFSIISGSLILIAVFILSYKIISAGMNVSKKNEAKDSLMRLMFGGIFILLAPLFIRFLLFINNSFVNLLITAVNTGSLEGSLGNSMLTSIRTGNAITTALVIAMFIYLFVKLNIKFIIRQFTIIIFTIFTPIACGLWIINKNVTAASIWAGQIIMNIFMQFIYCFLFLVYLAFLPSGGGWAVSLIWAMMILPIADTLMNCLQNLTSRIAGLDNEQMTGRVMGIGAMLGFSLGAIKEQFKNPDNTSSMKNGTNQNNNTGLGGFINRAKSIINPTMNLSDEKDYNGNSNPIRNVISKQSVNNTVTTPPSPMTANTTETGINAESRTTTIKHIATNVAKTGFNAAKTYFEVGAKMTEGNFERSPYQTKYNATSTRKKAQDTEYIHNLARANDVQKPGDSNESKK